MFGFSTFCLLVPLFSSFSSASAVQGGTATPITGRDGFCPGTSGHVNYAAWLGNQQNPETRHVYHWPAFDSPATKPMAGPGGGWTVVPVGEREIRFTKDFSQLRALEPEVLGNLVLRTVLICIFRVCVVPLPNCVRAPVVRASGCIVPSCMICSSATRTRTIPILSIRVVYYIIHFHV